MANLQLNIRPLIAELSRIDLRDALKNCRNQSVIIHNWNALMVELKKVAVKISKGETIGKEVELIKSLSTSLARSATEIGSMLPGPIGVACSLALAICCLVPPLDLLGFLLNILGAIPFARAGAKALLPFLDDVVRLAMNNPLVKGTLRAGREAINKTVRYNKEFAVNTFNRMTKNPFVERGLTSIEKFDELFDVPKPVSDKPMINLFIGSSI